jgi:hypothetical protein
MYIRSNHTHYRGYVAHCPSNHNKLNGNVKECSGSHNNIKGTVEKCTGHHNFVYGNVINCSGSYNKILWNVVTCTGNYNDVKGIIEHDFGLGNNSSDRKIPKKKQKRDCGIPGTTVPDAEEEEEVLAIDEKDACVVCMERVVSTVGVPCGHCFGCVACSRQLRNSTEFGKQIPCPICKKMLSSIMKTYHC